jgi:ADP-heptose:LPS heptosyltransferase
MPSPDRRLIVRLRNWIGDVTLGVPMLQRLADSGFRLQLVGKPWAAELLAGHGWEVHTQPAGTRERIALLRRLGREARAAETGFSRRINALCLPYSFSSALEFRLGGLRALGHAHEGRSLLLARARPRPRGRHELEVYWDIGNGLLGSVATPPPRIGLRLSERHRVRAAALREAQGIRPDAIFICPFAGGTWDKQEKTWPAFADFVARDLPAFGRQVVICPGPGEETVAHQRYGSATVLPIADLGTFAAVVAGAPLMIANDTGPGHIAAAVDTPLVSVLGPTDPALWRAWGPRVQVLRGAGTWPASEQVVAAVRQALQPG